jgi:hypothetical protein
MMTNATQTMQTRQSEGRRRSGSTLRRSDDHHQQSFQDDASREGSTPQAPSSSDQLGQGFRLERSSKMREEVEMMTPSRR